MVKILKVSKPYGVLVQKKWGDSDFVWAPSFYGIAEYGDTKFGFVDIIRTLSFYGLALYGVARFGCFALPPYSFSYGIYARRKCVEGITTIKMKFYKPANPQSPGQQANRNKLAAGIVVWQGLTDEQKEVYRKRVVGRSMSGYNLFLKEYMLS